MTDPSRITVFTARRIRSMNRSNPVATAVAVRDGRIREAGTPEPLRPWLDTPPPSVDARFRDAAPTPRFVDPHLHPTLAAILPPCPFITAREWRLPNRASPPLTSQETCMNRLTQIEAGLADPAEPLIAWGYHRSWHGAVTREMLSAAPADRPIALWQRSFHEGVADAAAIGWMGLDRADLERHPQAEPSTGRLFETGRSLAMRGMNPHQLAPQRFSGGLALVKQAIHGGGHSTTGERVHPLADDAGEWAALDGDDVPSRTRSVPRAALRGPSMARLGALEREGTATALHSDFTMAPALPLNSARAAVNRGAGSGAVIGAEERMNPDAAMRAITIDAACVLGMKNEIGSTRAGKAADCPVLGEDPWEVEPMALRDIPIRGTVFEGRPFPAAG